MNWGGYLIIALAVLILAGMLWSWLRRTKRDSGITVPLAPVTGTVRDEVPALHVATTAHDDPLNRLAITPLGFRARGAVVVTDTGVGLELDGSRTVFIPTAAIVGIGHATWTIDRTVETDGLVLLAWTSAEGTICDTYLRLDGVSPDRLIDAITELRAPARPTGEAQ